MWYDYEKNRWINRKSRIVRNALALYSTSDFPDISRVFSWRSKQVRPSALFRDTWIRGHWLADLRSRPIASDPHRSLNSKWPSRNQVMVRVREVMAKHTLEYVKLSHLLVAALQAGEVDHRNPDEIEVQKMVYWILVRIVDRIYWPNRDFDCLIDRLVELDWTLRGASQVHRQLRSER